MLRVGELSEAGRFVIDQFETYLDLAQAELAEQRRETVRRAIWGLAAGACGFLGFWFALLAILVAAWDTDYRLLVAIAIPVVLFIVAGIGIALAARGTAGQAWARLRREIQRDVVTLREILWTR